MTSPNSANHVVNELKDPEYVGVLFVRHFLKIIVGILVLLALVMILASRNILLDVNVRANVQNVAKCQNIKGTCLKLRVNKAFSEKIKVGQEVKMKASAGESYKQEMIQARVIGVDRQDISSESILVTASLLEEWDESTLVNPVYSLIVVEQKTIYSQVVDSLQKHLH